MGNQGMKNWKLFFAISLMLIAGVFSNAAIAGNGDGTIKVGWLRYGSTLLGYDNRANLPTDSYADQDQGTAGVQQSPALPATSRGNALRFTYTVSTDITMAGGELVIDLPDGWAIAKQAADASTTDFKEEDIFDNVLVMVGTTQLYDSWQQPITSDDLSKTHLNPAATKNSHGSVTIGDPIKVTLGTTWSRGGTLTIILGNVGTPTPTRLREVAGTTAYTTYPFVTKSKVKDGILVRLKPTTDNPNPQPRVRVGNILATRLIDKDGVLGDSSNASTTNILSDLAKRTVKVEPATTYPGEKHTYTVTFTAPGPMYNSTLAITLPSTTDLTIPPGKTRRDLISVSAPGVQYNFNPADTTAAVSGSTPAKYGLDADNGTLASIKLIRIDKDQKVTLTFRDATVGSGVDATDANASEFSPVTTTFNASPLNTDSRVNVTKIEGGAFALAAGSGKLTVDPTNKEVNQVISRLTLEYEAATALTDASLAITVPVGIMASKSTGTLSAEPPPPATATLKEEATFYLTTDSSQKGYISSPDSKGAAPKLVVPTERDIQTTGNRVTRAGEGGIDTTLTTTLGWTITGNDAAFASSTVDAVIVWENITLKAGETFRTYIDGVKVSAEGAKLMFHARVGVDGSDEDKLVNQSDEYAALKSVDFYVVDPQNEGVTFSASEPSAAAASKTTIGFTFTAKDTPLKDGTVQFTIPRGWTAPVEDKDFKKAGAVKVSGGDVDHGKGHVKVNSSARSIEVTVPALAKGKAVTIQYGGEAKATVQNTAETVKINGYYWASAGSPRRGAGTATIEITNAKDGTGTAWITPHEVQAGSVDDNIFIVTYEALGTMDGGAISLATPTGWGEMQDDPTGLNYIKVEASEGATVSEVDNGGTIIIVALEKCPPGGTVKFTYGDGTGARKGAKAQNSTTPGDTEATAFTIESRGDEFGTLEPVEGERKKATVTGDDPKYLGETFSDAPGELRVNVTGASDGSGTATVAIVKSNAGDADYFDDDGIALAKQEMRIHAADKNTHLRFVYTPIQTIENGALRFTVEPGWSTPQGSDRGTLGFTSITSTGTIGTPDFGEANKVTVPITLIDTSESITIDYGHYDDRDTGGAMAPLTTGNYHFSIDIKGGDGDANRFAGPIRLADGESLTVKVYPQASGGGEAAVTAGADDLRAGGDAKVTIEYKAAGQIDSGMLKLAVPAKWSAPTMENVMISSTGSVAPSSATDFGGYYTGDPDDASDDKTVPEGGPGALEVLVNSVMLKAGETVNFVYTTKVQATTGDASFTVELDGGAGPGAKAVNYANVAAPEDGTLTVSVGEAAAGSGMASVDLMGAIITANSSGNTLTFEYTAVGPISYPKEFRVKVPKGWSEPVSEADAASDAEGTYTVALKNKDGRPRNNIIETLAAVDMEMVARVKIGASPVAAGDVVTFTYENARAPENVTVSNFEVSFHQEALELDKGGTLQVVVQSAAGPSQVVLTADPTMFSRDAGATHTSTSLTVELQDADGNAAAMASDTSVTLSSTSATGVFTPASLTISAGSSMGEATYTDTALGMATLTAAATGLTSGTATVEVTTDAVTIDSASLDKTMAKVGDTVTVTAMGTAGLTTAMFSIGSIVTNASMTESAAAGGTYTGTYTPVADMHDGTHEVTVTFAEGVSMIAGALTVDTTAPTVSASASPMTVANGDTVTITATVSDAGSGVSSVSADASALDTTQTAAITLTMMEDSYSGSFTIGADNAADNGMHTVTVTAMDAAGNSATASATVTLNNTLSYTATLPSGISLFHVPLMEDGLNTVDDLRTKLGDAANLLITYDGTSWNSRSDAVAITSSLGILVSMGEETTVTFEGYAWSDGAINVTAGNNLVGLPLNDDRVTNVSDIGKLFDAGVVTGVIVQSGGAFNLVTQAGDAGDGPVMGHEAYLVMATAAGSAMVTGDGWMNSATSAAPIALTGYTVDNQTPVLDVNGSVVDEITGVAQEGFRVKVKNLSTKAALSEITSVEEVDGYNITFVDLNDAHAARVGDVLEISADSPNPLIGVKAVRHIVTVDDVKNSRIELEALIAYEIPAETELLRNYPNPFNPETWIPYRLAEDANVSLTIYDVNGELVRTIDIGHQSAAVYESRAKAIYWDGRNRFGEQVASGVYFYSLSAGDFSATRKMVILK